MPFDGILTKYTAYELNTLLKGGRIGKISQPDRTDIVMQIRANGENYRLLLSCNPSWARIHITGRKFENPDKPPAFCMVLRKHIGGGFIKGFYTDGFERIITMEMEVFDELGDKTVKKLVIEIMGRHSNIILLNENDKIIDVIKHVDQGVNRVRELLPARTYILPPKQDKLDPDNPSTYDYLIKEAANSGKKVSSFLLDKLKGFSPVLCREICHRAKIDDSTPVSSLSNTELINIVNALDNMMSSLRLEGPCPNLITDNQKPVDFHCVKLTQYKDSQNFDLISNAVDVFYNLKIGNNLNNQKASNLKKTVERFLEKTEKRLAINLQTYEENKDFENFKRYGELITANIHLLKKGDNNAHVLNYYSNTGEYMDIPLLTNKNPQENAQYYYRKYNKSKSAFNYARNEIETIRKEISYLESVLFAIENAQTSEELNEISLELKEQKYINKVKGKKLENPGSLRINPLSITSGDGFNILIGRNNKQNDRLTFKTARHEDIWLHVKNFPGSHTVIRTEGRDVPDSTLIEAAQYAAWYSKARNSSKVEVDYTTIRNVKKPSGAKPGMVNYFNYKTILVEPKKPDIPDNKVNGYSFI
jgi:predicted ribosome quality control (RQC) complex YloA/Tae2 family protein